MLSLVQLFSATRISANMFLLHADTPYFDGIRQCPKSPLFFGIYTSVEVFRRLLLTNLFFSAVLYIFYFYLFLAKVIDQMIDLQISESRPPSCHRLHFFHFLTFKNSYPQVRSYIDFLTLSWEGSRATWKVLPQLVTFQVLVAAVGSYFTLWGRNR
uniref:Uncharacterized protein n=1 Tax=Parascaris equorum TaxID=6256 RepID=A0A914R154_PAREQ